MNNIIIMIVILSLIFIIFIISYNEIEGADFDLDPLHIPEDPTTINDVNIRRYVRIIGIDRDLKFDKYGRIENVTFKKPKPELGEKNCKRFTCPATYTSVACWKCS